jgi:hypothetical protein
MKHILSLILGAIMVMGTTSLVAAQTYTNTFTKDGKTYIQTKTVTPDKIVIETKIYDESGQLLSTKVTEKDPPPPPVKKQTEPTTKPAAPAPTTKPVTTPTALPTPTSVPVPVEPETEELPAPGVEVLSTTQMSTNFPLYMNEDTGNLVVQTGFGEFELRVKPEMIAAKAWERGLNVAGAVRVEESQGKLVYVAEGYRERKLLALIPLKLSAKHTYDLETGELELVEQSRWAQIAGWFSL